MLRPFLLAILAVAFLVAGHTASFVGPPAGDEVAQSTVTFALPVHAPEGTSVFLRIWTHGSDEPNAQSMLTPGQTHEAIVTPGFAFAWDAYDAGEDGKRVDGDGKAPHLAVSPSGTVTWEPQADGSLALVVEGLEAQAA